MIADLFEIKETDKYSKGVFATQFIPKGTIVYFYLCKKCGKYSKEELAKMSKKELRFVIDHQVKLKSGEYSKFCDDRLSYINHSCNANILDSGKGFSIVVRDIEKGEEGKEDYRLLEGEDEVRFPGGCKCGEPVCMK